MSEDKQNNMNNNNSLAVSSEEMMNKIITNERENFEIAGNFK